MRSWPTPPCCRCASTASIIRPGAWRAANPPAAAAPPSTPARQSERRLGALSDGNILRRGDILRLCTGGGGGHGHPFDRPPEHVLDDVLDGFVSAAAAFDHYGVMIRDETIDIAATKARRSDRPEAKAFHRGSYVDAIR